MKKLIPLFILPLALLFTMCSQNSTEIKTNYSDLPENKVEELNTLLKTDSSNIISLEGAEVMIEFMKNTVLSNENPISTGENITGNYFWYIYNSLPEFVNKDERHSGYYRGESDQSSEDKLLAYSIYRLDRNPENLKKIFEIIKPRIKDIVSVEKYESLNIDREVASMLGTYKQISEIPDYKVLLAEAYSEIDTTTGSIEYEGDMETFRSFENSAYGFSNDLVSEIISKHLSLDCYSNLYSSPYLSFWMRRNKEGNMETVYSILSEIDELYR
jgi:hypothetical protein